MQFYTNTEYERKYQESLSYEQIESNIRGFDEVLAFKCHMSEEKQLYVKLTSGIELMIFDENILVDQNLLVDHYDYCGITSKFFLNGYHSVICPGIKGVAEKYVEQGGQSYLFYLPDIEEIEQYWGGDRLKGIKISIELDIIRKFITDLDTVPKQVQRLIEDKKPQKFHTALGGLTSQMQQVIKQIWHHPYQGGISRIYLEGKVLELIAMQLAQMADLEKGIINSSLKPQSIERIYQARDILAARLENPPSNAELAKQIGVSPRTLQRGFRELFGTTVVGYLTQKRLTKAELLLREKQLSVAEVSNMVGYSHFGYFAKVFKKRFGITPSECFSGKTRKIN
ncbi:MAG: AraC family transcriptional regulator [Cyanobacteria bacterium P01_F01_bin.143]